MLLTVAFRIRGTSPQAEAYFDRESGHRNADRERSEKLSDHANAKRDAKRRPGKGGNRTS